MAGTTGRKELDTPYALAAAKAGYVAAAMDYSSIPYKRRWPAAAQDAFEAVDSLRSRAGIYGFDPKHLVAAGWSAGGNLAELLGTVGRGTDRVAAVVSWSGISDLADLTRTPTTGGCEYPGCTIDKLAYTLQQLIGCSVERPAPRSGPTAHPSRMSGRVTRPPCSWLAPSEFIPLSQSTKLQFLLGSMGINTGLDVVQTDLHGGDLRMFSLQPFMDWLHRYADVSSNAPATQPNKQPTKQPTDQPQQPAPDTSTLTLASPDLGVFGGTLPYGLTRSADDHPDGA